jgi:hypothetical protein
LGITPDLPKREGVIPFFVFEDGWEKRASDAMWPLRIAPT